MNRTILQWLLPIILIIICFAIGNKILNTTSSAKKKNRKRKSILSINTKILKPKSYSPTIKGFGTIRAKYRTQLKSQVTGKITHTLKEFNNGAYVKKGAILVSIEKDDILEQIKIEKSNLLEAELLYQEEEIKAKEVKDELKTLNSTIKPSPLLLRLPQLKVFQSKIESAKAKLNLAKLNLKRTEIITPFDCKIINRLVSKGSILNKGESIGEIYKADELEVVFPVDFEQGKTLASVKELQKLPIIVQSYQNSNKWNASIRSTESTTNVETRQTSYIANIILENNLSPPQPGDFVNISTKLPLVENVYFYPSDKVYENSYVYTFHKGKLKRKEINILWKEDEFFISDTALGKQEEYVITLLTPGLDGFSATKLSDKPKSKKNKGSRK